MRGAPAWSACYLSIFLVSRLEFWSESRGMDPFFPFPAGRDRRLSTRNALCPVWMEKLKWRNK
eukprot:scaffold83086_cov57-Attheya_sp.AAC.1